MMILIFRGLLFCLICGVSEYESAGITYLFRKKNGVYYWMKRFAGAPRRGSLKTKSKSVAKSRL